MKPEIKFEVSPKGDHAELVIREGKALEIKEPRIVKISGILDSPFNWLEKKLGLYVQTDLHILVDREKFSIEMHINEKSFYEDIVVGRLEQHPDFKKFEINTGHQFNNFELADFFKMNRSAFDSPSTAMKLVSELKSFKAKIDKEVEKAKDDRGNYKLAQQQAVDSNLPEKFFLNIPLFKGIEKTNLEVEIYISPLDLLCSLVSPQANDLIVEISDKAIDTELDKIRSLAPNIAIIEQ
jgi:hypothetical protein